MLIHDSNTTTVREFDQLAPDLSDPRFLLSTIQQLRDDICREGQALFARWRPTIRRRAFLISGRNLACYLAVQNLPELIVHAAGRQPFGVMIARGDLAVEIGYQRLAEIQEEIFWLCEAAHVPVIWATQVLENFVRKGIPSRAEMTDAAMAERAECVMLNKGPYVADAVTILDDVLTRMQDHQVKKTPQLRALRAWAQSLPH